MKLLGAEVRPVSSGSRTLKDAINEAIRDWVTNVETTFYLFGSAAGPHPYPRIVRDFQSIIGKEARQQILEQEGRLPDIILPVLVVVVTPLVFSIPSQMRQVQLIGVEAGGIGPELAECRDTVLGRPGFCMGHSAICCKMKMGKFWRHIVSQRD